eukprot:scaffold14198_cov124-Isochrysis_galbana.AAC.2
MPGGAAHPGLSPRHPSAQHGANWAPTPSGGAHRFTPKYRCRGKPGSPFARDALCMCALSSFPLPLC